MAVAHLSALFSDDGSFRRFSHGMADREPPERYAGCLATGASPAPIATSLARRITGARSPSTEARTSSPSTIREVFMSDYVK